MSGTFHSVVFVFVDRLMLQVKHGEEEIPTT
jgi:hypothetical protein